MSGARSDIGRMRRRNEDSFLVRPPLFAVADGMGGHRGGNVASSMTVEALERATLPPDGIERALVEVVRQANREVFERGESDSELAGMGTTVTAFVRHGSLAYLAHVGDSRAYLLRDAKLRRLTEDHTLVQQWVHEGKLQPEQADRHPAQNIMTRALGVDEEVEVDADSIELRVGDRFLLCSDGLTHMVGDEAVRDVLASHVDPQAACDALVEAANSAGGDDNITVVVLDVVEGDADEPEPEAPAPATAQPVMADPPTASTPAVGAQAGVEAPGATATRARVGTARHSPERRRWRRAVVAVAVVVILAVAALVGIRIYVDRQWYVGDSGGNVAVFNGVPSEFLRYDLSHVEVVFAELPVARAEQLELWKGRLQNGITVGSEAAALAIVEQIRRDLLELTDTSPTGSAG